jgi:hypothetical protein
LTTPPEPKKIVHSPKIRSLTELDALVGELVVGETPSIHWQDSQGLFEFESEQEALDSLRDPFFQRFLPNVDWTTAIVEVKSYRNYSSDLAAALEVVESLNLQGKKLILAKENGRWAAKFGTATGAASLNAMVAICVAALSATGIEAELAPNLA